MWVLAHFKTPTNEYNMNMHLHTHTHTKSHAQTDACMQVDLSRVSWNNILDFLCLEINYRSQSPNHRLSYQPPSFFLSFFSSHFLLKSLFFSSLSIFSIFVSPWLFILAQCWSMESFKVYPTQRSFNDIGLDFLCDAVTPIWCVWYFSHSSLLPRSLSSASRGTELQWAYCPLQAGVFGALWTGLQAAGQSQTHLPGQLAVEWTTAPVCR